MYESDLQEELDRALKNNKATTFPVSSLVIPEANRKIPHKGQEDKISSHEKELLRVFLRGDSEAISFIENNLETSFINNDKILKIIEHLLDEFINNGRFDLAGMMNYFDDKELAELIMDAASDKHEPSQFNDSTFDSLLEKEITPVFGIKYAKDVINRLRIEDYNRQIELLKKDPENLKEVFELKKEVSKLLKSTG